MDKTASNEQLQKKEKHSAKKTEEIKVSRQIALALKREWEELARKQQESGHKIQSGHRVSSISLVRNRHGKIAVKVSMENGKRIYDNARENAVASFKKIAETVYARNKVEEFLKKIKEYGYAAVEAEIPADLKEAVLKGMEKANISTSYKGEKAEAQAARENSQRAAEFANNTLNASGLSSNAFLPYSIAGTAAIIKAMNNGVKIGLPTIPDNISPSIANAAKESIVDTLDVAAKLIGDRQISGLDIPRLFSSAVCETETITRRDGTNANITIKGDALSSPSTSNKTQILLNLLDEKDQSPAMQEIYSKLERDWQKRHPGEPCSKKQLEASLLAGEFVNNVSIKSLKEEYNNKSHSYSPAFKKEMDAFMAKEKEAKAKRNRIENEQKMKQLETVVLSDSAELTAEGQKLKEQLKQNGIISLDQLKEDQNKTIVENILKQNKLFIQREGKYFTSSRAADVKAYDEKKQEFQKSPCLLQRLLSKEIPLSGQTFEKIYQDARSHKGHLPQEIQDQQRLLYCLQRQNGLNKADVLSEAMLKDVESLYAEYQSRQAKDSSVKLQSFLEEKGLVATKEKTSPAKPSLEQQSKKEKDVTEKPVPVAVQQAPKTDAAEKQPSLTEKERVISKIKENMERYKETADRPPQTAEKPKAVKGIGLQGKIQQQQTSKAPTKQNVLSPAVQAALINKKERE